MLSLKFHKLYSARFVSMKYVADIWEISLGNNSKSEGSLVGTMFVESMFAQPMLLEQCIHCLFFYQAKLKRESNFLSAEFMVGKGCWKFVSKNLPLEIKVEITVYRNS